MVGSVVSLFFKTRFLCVALSVHQADLKLTEIHLPLSLRAGIKHVCATATRLSFLDLNELLHLHNALYIVNAWLCRINIGKKFSLLELHSGHFPKCFGHVG